MHEPRFTGTVVNMGGDHPHEQSAHVKTGYSGPVVDPYMNYELPRQPQGAPTRERPTPANIRQEQMPQYQLQDANI